MGWAEDQLALQRRLAREAQERAEAARRQQEADLREKERLARQREELNRQLQQTRDDKKRAALEDKERKKRGVQSQRPFVNTTWPSTNPPPHSPVAPDPISPWNHKTSGNHSSGNNTWFSFVDDWFDSFMGEPSRARKILVTCGVVGCLTGIGIAQDMRQPLAPYAFIGAAIGFIFIYLLKFSVKVVLAACVVGVAGLVLYGLLRVAK
jgi:hypothetical protein